MLIDVITLPIEVALWELFMLTLVAFVGGGMTALIKAHQIVTEAAEDIRKLINNEP